jgi:hypothetical protein
MASEPLRPQLGAHAEALIADVLDNREEAIINGVRAKLPNLDPQLALVAWVQLDEARKLRKSLITRAELENSRRAAAS